MEYMYTKKKEERMEKNNNNKFKPHHWKSIVLIIVIIAIGMVLVVIECDDDADGVYFDGKLNIHMYTLYAFLPRLALNERELSNIKCKFILWSSAILFCRIFRIHSFILKCDSIPMKLSHTAIHNSTLLTLEIIPTSNKEGWERVIANKYKQFRFVDMCVRV